MSTQITQCPRCHAELTQNALFCSQCGTALSTERLKQELVTKSIPDVLKYYD
ncbi:MAG: zinc ribbon domain-containing protein, partial [Ktedonobacteraceae bacterium]|nr:zinc ribbon domain-containing protein [Ktedonobacteraceae bacterium]